MDNLEKRSIAKKVTIFGGIFDLILGIAKIIVGQASNSHSIFVDGIHSLSDLFTDFFVVFISHYSHDEPDEDHPYGHGRIETFGTVVMGVLLILAGGLLAYENAIDMVSGKSDLVLGPVAVIVTCISIVIKELLYHYQVRAGKLIGSKMIIANAWHSRSDAFSSLLVLVGLFMSYFGISWADSLMAIAVSFMLIKIGWDFMWNAVQELVDTSLNSELVSQIQNEILSINGVFGLHNLRSRKVGDKALLDVNIEVSSDISVSEGHQIATWVAQRLIRKFSDVIDVTVHTDVEDDLAHQAHAMIELEDRVLLPLRNEILEHFFSRVKGHLEQKDVAHIQLHYIEDKVNLELQMMNFDKAQDLQLNKLMVDKLCSDLPWWGKLTILVELP